MAVQLLQENHGQSVADPTEAELTAPAAATFLVLSVASSTGAGSPTWNGVGFNLAQVYAGTKIMYQALPDVGTHVLSIPGVSTHGSAWLALWLKNVNLAGSVRTVGNTVNPGASFNVTGQTPGDYLAYAGYAYPDEDGYGMSGTGFTMRAQYYTAGYKECSTVGDAGMLSAAAYTISLSGADGDDYHGWAVFAAAGGGSQVIMVMAERWKGFLNELRAGLIPRDLLRRTYREAVAI